MISTTFIQVEDGWTIEDFRDKYANADDILRANNLPNSSNPFGTIAEQLTSQAAILKEDTIITERDQIDAIAKNCGDLLYAIEMSNWSLSEFDDYVRYGSHPQYLTVPAELCDRSQVYDRSYYYDKIQECETVSDAHDLLRQLLPSDYTASIVRSIRETGPEPSEWFWENRGEVSFTLFLPTAASGSTTLPIPCWPESVSDNVIATWSQEMTTFQHYEPRQTYKGSGPRTVSCTFKLHRAMWDGDQDSGKCEELISLMEAAVYPDYDTQEADPPRCTLRIGQSVQIHGIMTNMDKTFDGPIGPDVKYDCVTVSITIIEESNMVLSSKAIRDSKLAGWR